MKRGSREKKMESVDTMAWYSSMGGGFGYPLSFRIKHQRWSRHYLFVHKYRYERIFVLFFLSLYMHLWWKGKEMRDGVEVYITTYILADRKSVV